MPSIEVSELEPRVAPALLPPAEVPSVVEAWVAVEAAAAGEFSKAATNYSTISII
jgi:hypothetical protein